MELTKSPRTSPGTPEPASDGPGAPALELPAPAAVLPLPVPREQAGPALAEEQLAYARVLDRGMKLGLALLTVTFLLYVLGVMAPHVPVAELPRYWSLPVHEYLKATGTYPGWAWVHALHEGDVVNFVGIVFLAGVTIACYLAVIPLFFRKRDRVYAWIAIVEVAVLALAASGWLRAGGH